MGVFNRLKGNFNHGGIKLKLQAPVSASMKDAAIPVTVNLTAGEEQHTITNVSVELIEEPDLSSSPTQQRSQQQMRRSLGIVRYEQPFVIMPGETKSVPLSIIMNIGAALGQLPGADSAGVAQLTGALKKLQELTEVMSNAEYTYTIMGSAKVEGIATSVSGELPIQLLKPNQFSLGDIEHAFHKSPGAQQPTMPPVPTPPVPVPLPPTPDPSNNTLPQPPPLAP